MSLQPLFSIAGLGAVGKTALALELAWYVVQHPDDFPYQAVVWVPARVPALIPIGQTPAPQRPAPVPHTRARICQTLAALLNLPWLQLVAESGDGALQDRALQSVFGSRSILLVLDEIEQVRSPEEAALHTLLRTLPAPSRALVTARRYHAFPPPAHLIGLSEEEATAFLAQERLALGIGLDAGQQRIIQEWSHRLPYAIRVALCRIQCVGHDRALADLARGPAGLIRPVVGRLICSLHDEQPNSYLGLRRLAAQDDIARGITRDKARWLLAPYDSQAADNILAPLTQANLVVCVYRERDSREHGSSQGDSMDALDILDTLDGYLTIPPLVLWYLRQTTGIARAPKEPVNLDGGERRLRRL